MRNIIYVLLALAIAFSACKKDKNAPKQYSTWYVNGQEFKTNNVNVTKGKVVSYISSADTISSRFQLVFHYGYFPVGQEMLIDCSQQNPAWCCLSFYGNGKGYSGNGNGYLYGTMVNGKASYQLDSAWFVDNQNPSDSILVYGTFNEP